MKSASPRLFFDFTRLSPPLKIRGVFLSVVEGRLKPCAIRHGVHPSFGPGPADPGAVDGFPIPEYGNEVSCTRKGRQ